MKMSLHALQSGGSDGQRQSQQLRQNEPEWNLGDAGRVNLDNEDNSTFNSETSESFSSGSDDDFREAEDKGECCLTNMVGNRILSIAKVAKVLQRHTCCCRCAFHNHKNYIKDFLDFCKEYEERVAQEEQRELFMSRTQRL